MALILRLRTTVARQTSSEMSQTQYCRPNDIDESKRSLIGSFANGIANDKGAVHAAITQPWSNGQVEAQITKLKLVKRQMYGRAKLDLLQARLIGVP
jgi:transposase